ncbi:hypothetical protein GUJ93_ZPchr0001g30719 [Zizania palustris]|uniref:Uncharacterized protein n=1 Tax=Zizania palustris TaxID=103762 RepID=A0A8J5R5E2_ZIZPA|nr:hypothetical protein GUJ93_ZPchr0001g30719 [Zizania palustris]
MCMASRGELFTCGERKASGAVWGTCRGQRRCGAGRAVKGSSGSEAGGSGRGELAKGGGVAGDSGEAAEAGGGQ